MQRHTSLFRRPQSRRGALLLVVLSILVLFALVGLTFVVAAGAFRRGADANLRRDVNRNDAPKETDNVVMQLIRGPRLGTGSSILGHDLLRDMYGNGSVAVTAGSNISIAVNIPTDGSSNQIRQMRQIVVTSTPPQDLPALLPDLHLIQDYYTGSFVTFTDGDARGQSHRILHFLPIYDTSTGNFHSLNIVIDREPDTTRYSANGSTPGLPADDDSFVVNDPPFDGTGYGFDPTEPTTGKRSMDLTDTAGHQVAFSPHIAQAYPTGIANSAGISIEAGGADEAYDAPDYQNMYLSYIPLDTFPPNPSDILPSFHRQDLIRFWENKEGTPFVWDNTSTHKDLQRKIILRPTKIDHPNFTGSNPTFDPLNGPWDIDNDLDGVADSIWIDVGLPLKTDRQGRRYKPLAAILVKDLDALVNVNAHGFYSQFHDFAVQGEASAPLPGVASAGTTTSAAQQLLTHFNFSPAWNGTNPAPMVLPLGSGYGPPEVSLLSLFGTESAYKLLHSRYTGMNAENPVGVPGERAIDDPRSRMDHVGLLDNYNSAIGNIFGTPPDRLGIGRTYFDYAGRPRFQPSLSASVPNSQASPGTFTQRTDDPFEIDLLHSHRHDSPFTYQELERVLRYEEFDSSQLSQSDDRLLDLASTELAGSGNAKNRKLITTASFSVPTAGRVDIPHDLRGEDVQSGTVRNELLGRKEATDRRPAPTLVTLLHERIRRNHPGVTRAQLNEATRILLPPEILRGEPLDLNRLLEAPADGNDNDGSNGVDDIFELQSQAIASFQTGISTSPPVTSNSNFFPGRNSVHQHPAPTGAASYSATRQLMARHLYVIMLLLTEDELDTPYFLPTIDASLTADDKRELTKRRIAQWAINVVDFRDQDGIMTPFEYDVNPFTVDGTPSSPYSTWNVDGDLTTGASDDWRRVVWGAEAPDLIITETLAFHDRGIKDTIWDDDQQRTRGPDLANDDEHLDQYKIPQGSLFLEFYNPRNLASNNGILPRELYNTNGQLHLNRRANGGTGDPVWRVLIVDREEQGGGPPSSLTREMAARPDTITFQPRSASGAAGADMTESDDAGLRMLPTETEDYQIDRVIYFANHSPTHANAPGRDREFRYRGSQDVLLWPEQHFVVAPRQTTYIGSRRDPMDANFNVNGSYSFQLNDPYLGTIRFLQNGTVNAFPRTYPTFTTGIKPNVAITATMDAPDGWSEDPDGAPAGIGLNITEPFRDNYYPEPTFQNPNPNVMSSLTQYYTDETSNSAPDIPFESQYSSYAHFPLNDENAANEPLYHTKTIPSKASANTIDFASGYKSAVLQRLANPSSNYDPTQNPYITVDSMAIDLTVFNGEDGAEGRTGDAAMVDADDWDQSDSQNAQTVQTVYFGSRERGKRDNGQRNVSTNADQSNRRNSTGNLMGLVGQLEPDMVADANEMANAIQQTPPIWRTDRDTTNFDGEHFGRPLLHTIGYVNSTYGAPIPSNLQFGGVTVDGNYVGSPIPVETARPEDPRDPTSAAVTPEVHNNPFAWLQWANAPYVSEYDLMLVPSSSPQRLLFEYSIARRDPSTGNVISPYLDATTPEGDEIDRIAAPYSYLLNFFHSSRTPSSTGPSNAQMSAQFVRFFDFVHVPSRFNGTKKWFAADSGTAGNFNPASPAATDPRLGYLFPFNYRSMFREPGKINLNTIPSDVVYKSIFDDQFWQSGNVTFSDWDEFRVSRRGYTGSELAENFPSRFSNPFRTAATAELMPQIPIDPNRLKQPPVEATVLRSLNPDPAATNDRPLFDLRLTDPLLTNSAMRHYRTDENPMLRYQAYQRLGNIAGTQSNVFAVWVTIGYFEVEPAPVGPQHPDGWRLAEELGNDTGEINRHRAFYIIDRSVPVGYLPGEDLNAEQTIMLKRFIE